MTNNYTFLSVLYSVVLGFVVSFASLYLLHLIRTYLYSSVYYGDRHQRILKACRRVEATRSGYSTSFVDGVAMRKDVYAYRFEGKKYHYVRKGQTDLGDTLTLFFLSNPATACQEDELCPKQNSWSRWLVPLALFISAVFYKYVNYYMVTVAA